MRTLLATLLAFLALAALAARADDKAEKPEKAPTPGHAVILLKQAWDKGDLDAIVARYAEPGASFIRSDLAALKRIEDAQTELATAITEKLSAAAAEELVPPEKRLSSPLLAANVTMLASRVKNDRASTKFRVATKEGERFFRFTHVLVDGDWKIVVASLDGTPLDEKALALVAAATAAHGRAADELSKLAREVRAGTVGGRDAIRKRIGALLAEEKRAIDEDKRGEKRDELHDND